MQDRGNRVVEFFKDSERLKVLAFIYSKKIKINSSKFNLVQDTEEQLLNSSCGSQHDSRLNGLTPTYERYMY